jgi:hypothetical protein
MPISAFPIQTAQSPLTASQGVDALQKAHDMPSAGAVSNAITKINNATLSVQTLADAVELAELGGISVGDAVTTNEYHSGTGLGGNKYQLIDGQGSRPTEDGGSVIHVGSGDLYFKSLTETFNPDQFGALSDGSDSTTQLQNWINSSKSLFASSASSQREYIYSTLTITGENKKLTIVGDVKFTSNDASTNSKITLEDDYIQIENGFFGNIGGNGATIETKGFSNYLINLQVSGSSPTSSLFINGLETKVVKGRYRGGSNAVVLIAKADAYLDGPYIEQGKDGVKTVGAGSVNGYHVHSFNNSRHGFNLSSASFSQFNSCYADTNGENGYTVSDTYAGLTFTDCWAFQSAEVVAGGVGYQFSNSQNVKMIGCRISGSGAAGTSASIRFSGSDNQVDLMGCTADDEMIGFNAPNTVSGCSGVLAKYNNSPNVFRTFGNSIPASSTLTSTIRIKLDESIATPSTRSFKVEIVRRSTSGATSGDTALFYVNVNSFGTNTIQPIVPSSPVISINSISLSDASNNLVDVEIEFQNNDSNGQQFSYQIEDIGTSRGYN